jgi:hypothetical protein
MVMMTAIQSGAAAAPGANGAGIPTAAGFVGCIHAVQGQVAHHMTLHEAQACGRSLPEIDRSQVDAQGISGRLPNLYIAISGSQATLEWSGAAEVGPAVSLFAIQFSCYNTWTYPDPGFFTGNVWGNLSTAGYGNHCGYANVPSTPTFNLTCVGCTGLSKTAGHADSTWDNANYGVNAGLGWGNATFYLFGFDSYSCRAWVSTSGSQSPSAWCN